MSQSRSIFSQLPLLPALAGRLAAPPKRRSSSDWLYQHVVLDWIYRSRNRRQLPLSYQLFSLWCQLQRPVGGYIRSGRAAFGQAIRANHFLRGPDSVLLNLDHCRIALDLTDPRMLAVPRELREDSHERRMLRILLSPGDSFIDIGANHGSFCVMAAPIVGPSGRIIAVEPQPRLASLLRRTLPANIAPHAFELLTCACSDHSGEATFYRPNSTSGRAGLIAGYSAADAHDSFTVPLAPFDDCVDWRSLPGKLVVKLDIEGGEPAFLRGAMQMIAAHQPTIILEINLASIAAAGGTLGSLQSQLHTLGYRHFAPCANPTDLRPLADLSAADAGNIIIRF